MLLLLMDCIHQLILHHPTYFEYTEDLLMFLIDQFYHARFVIFNIDSFRLSTHELCLDSTVAFLLPT